MNFFVSIADANIYLNTFYSKYIQTRTNLGYTFNNTYIIEYIE